MFYHMILIVIMMLKTYWFVYSQVSTSWFGIVCTDFNKSISTYDYRKILLEHFVHECFNVLDEKIQR